MTTQIQQAESAIKAGDTKTAFEILREVLAENPDSERAWWVMSGLVPREQRTICLEQVLRVNPDNRMARETLQKLLVSPPQPETKPPRQVPQPEPRQAGSAPPLQSFLTVKGSRNYLIILGDKRLIRAHIASQDIPRAQDALQQGNIPERYLQDMKTISLASIESVKQKGTSLQVAYQAGSIDSSLRLAFEDQNKAMMALGVLTKKLGYEYKVQTRPLNTGLSLGISALLTLGSVSFSAWTLWGMQQISVSLGQDRGQYRMAASLLDALGSIGVLALCGGTILVALGISAWLLLKPPVSTELVRRG